MMRLPTPFLATVLFTSVAAGGLTPALAQSTPAPADSGAAHAPRQAMVLSGNGPGEG
jgi:hypothetical protein